MAIYITDRQKRIQGDRIVHKKAAFDSVGPEITIFHGKFCVVHKLFAVALEIRRKEEVEDIGVRKKRDKLVSTAIRQYKWAWKFPSTNLLRGWEAQVDQDLVDSVRKRLFPFGKPKNIHSTQLVNDGLNHFIVACERETDLIYPAEFIKDAKNTSEQLSATISLVVKESNETTGAIVKHKEARVQWEVYYKSLKEATSAYLRIQGRHTELSTLFSTTK